MKSSDNENLYIRICEYGRNHPTGFSESELKDALNLNEWEIKIIDGYIRNAIMNGLYLGNELGMQSTFDTMFFAIDRGDAAKFIIKYDAYFNYIDFLEFKEAIRSSNKAKNLALWAIGISSFLALASILIQLFGSVTLDDMQLKKILNKSEGKHDVKGMDNKENNNFYYIH